MSHVEPLTVVVQAVPLLRIKATRSLDGTALRTCPECKEMTPHFRTVDGYECCACGLRTYKVQLSNGTDNPPTW